MPSPQVVKNFARNSSAHRNLLLVGLLASITSMLFFSWMSVWAGHQHGWETTPAAIIFGLLGAGGIIGAVLFGAQTWSWFSEYKRAAADLEMYETEPEAFLKHFRSVLGPMRWRG